MGWGEYYKAKYEGEMPFGRCVEGVSKISCKLVFRKYFNSYLLFHFLKLLKNLLFSGYIRAKILLDNKDYANIIKECTDEIENAKERGDDTTIESDKGKFCDYDTKYSLCKVHAFFKLAKFFNRKYTYQFY